MSITDGLKRGTIEIMLLTMLRDEDMYGYQICQEFEKRSQGLQKLRKHNLLLNNNKNAENKFF